MEWPSQVQCAGRVDALRVNWLAGGFAVLVLVVIAGFALRGLHEAPAAASKASSVEPSVVVSGALGAGVDASAVPPGDPASVPAGRGADRPSLLMRSRTAADLRVFVFEAKKEIERGGAYYAHEALLECRLFRESFLRSDRAASLRHRLETDDGPSARSRLVALDSLEKRCAGFTDEELGVKEQLFLLGWATEKDPLMALRRRVTNVDRSNAVTQGDLLASMMATGDPRILGAVRGVAMVRDSDNPDELVSYLNGAKFGGMDEESYIYAWDIAVCEVTQSCLLPSPELRAECAVEGRCFDSVQARVLSAVGDKARFDRINETAGQIREALSRKDARAFLPAAPR